QGGRGLTSRPVGLVHPGQRVLALRPQPADDQPRRRHPQRPQDLPAWEQGVGHGRQTRSATQACTLASAPGRAAASVPPAMAMSGLPPPLPPTCWATKLTSSPALSLPTRSAVTPAAS